MVGTPDIKDEINPRKKKLRKKSPICEEFVQHSNLKSSIQMDSDILQHVRSTSWFLTLINTNLTFLFTTAQFYSAGRSNAVEFFCCCCQVRWNYQIILAVSGNHRPKLQKLRQWHFSKTKNFYCIRSIIFLNIQNLEVGCSKNILSKNENL